MVQHGPPQRARSLEIAVKVERNGVVLQHEPGNGAQFPERRIAASPLCEFVLDGVVHFLQSGDIAIMPNESTFYVYTEG